MYEPNIELPIIPEETQKPVELVQVETLPLLNETFGEQNVEANDYLPENTEENNTNNI
jgi:hypothetical protein